MHNIQGTAVSWGEEASADAATKHYHYHNVLESQSSARRLKHVIEAGPLVVCLFSRLRTSDKSLWVS